MVDGDREEDGMRVGRMWKVSDARRGGKGMRKRKGAVACCTRLLIGLHGSPCFRALSLAQDIPAERSERVERVERVQRCNDRFNMCADCQDCSTRGPLQFFGRARWVPETKVTPDGRTCC